ncbi:MAG: hypothetical protein IK115_00500 [Lachnospiraceae bacterium]|nr:hypothetical protein [Lachnospiraceae bacterium]
MKKGMLATIGAAALSLGLLCGCGATTESVVEKMFDEAAESFACTVEMDVDGSAGVSGFNVDFGLSGTADMEVDNNDADAPAYHMLADIKASAMGSSEKVKTEAYVITENNNVKTYTLDPDSDEWTLTEVPVEENPLDSKSRKKMISELKDVLGEAQLQKKAEKIGSESCHVLKLNTTADAFKGIVKIAMDAVDDKTKEEIEDAGVDLDKITDYLSFITIDATIYASQKTGRCVQLDVNLGESDFAGLIKKVSKDFGSMADGLGVDMSSVKLEFDKLSFSVMFSDWDDVKVKIPKDVEENARNSGGIDLPIDPEPIDPDPIDPEPEPEPEPEPQTGLSPNRDGSYTLYDYYGNPVVDVYEPNGFEIDSSSSEDFMSFWDDDWNYVSVYVSSMNNWDNVLNNGESHKEDGYEYFLLEGDGDNVSMMVDLGFLYDGEVVYAAVEGDYDKDAGDFVYPSYYITWKIDEDHWVQVTISSGLCDSWDDPGQFEDFFDQMFH